MGSLIGKPVNFIFNTRAIARAYTFNNTTEHGRPIKPTANNLVSGFISLSHPAA